MDRIVKKQINGQDAYYFELFIRSPLGKKGISRYLGKTGKIAKEVLTKNIFNYYEDFARVVIEQTGKSVKNYFKYTGVDQIEFCRSYYQALKHPLNRYRFLNFQAIFMTLFALNSARAEGSRMARSDLEHSIQKKKSKTREQREALNSVKAILWAFSNEFTWSTYSIRKLHGILFEGLEPELAGKYKAYENVAGDNLYGGITSTTSPGKVKKAMQKLVLEIKEGKGQVFPPILALETHLKFESIHPFHDGNGRVGRILLNRILMENGFMPVIFFEENHEKYCNSIALAREGRKDKYIKLFVEQVAKTRKVFEEEEQSKEFISKRKNMAISWDFERERMIFKFKNLPKYKS